MRNLIRYIFLLVLIICASTTCVYAQDNTPSFQSLVASGDKEYANKEYIKAKTYYQEALRLKPDNTSAKNKLNNTLQKIREESQKEEQFFEFIDNADQLYSNNELEKALEEYNKALKIFPKDEYALGKKSEITSILKDEKERLDAFNEMVALGDRLLQAEKFAEAVVQYESALKVYPNNSATKAKYQDAKNKKEAYDTKVSEFERFKSQGREFTLRKKYTEAISSYEQALQLFPQDKELQGIISELQTQKNISDNYNAKITEADALYEDRSYAMAKEAYNAALSVVPDDSYALGMINRIDEITNSTEYKKIQSDKAKLDRDFANYINKGESAESQNDYASALSYYVKALELKPNNAEANAKKKNAEDMIMYQKEHRKEQELSAALEGEYNNYVTQGDTQFNSKNYEKAIEFYTKAINVNTGNPYPSEKIRQIREMLATNKLVELVPNAVTININETKRIEFQPIDIAVRRSNFITIRANSLGEKPVIMFITYGSNAKENGSITVRVPVKSDNDIIVHIGSQYKWFSEDNNWIEIYPENGNVQIVSMEITKDN